ncbi:AfsR/SARP family transcriptional regulator [Lentzea kentuckyensis]|uniref:AfsR/SARP family transcriptional regulator n=1 Tax=Lentzea kentuckyensis TaxID=360086 RepID=UPI000A3A83A4|nr:hypothetical protein [Lentzea kentuckyensis]
MEFRVMGPVEVRCDDRVEVLSGRLQRTLLGVLLARANQPVPVDVLTDALWGDRPDPRAAQKLQLQLHRLHGALDTPDRLSFSETGYRLRPGRTRSTPRGSRRWSRRGWRPRNGSRSARSSRCVPR